VPVAEDGNVRAWIALGGKLSEQGYDAEDREFLRASAAQIAAGLRQARFREQQQEFDRLRREVLAHVTSELNLLKECPRCGICYDRAAERCTRDGEELTIALPVERTIGGKYRLEQRLGKGGMGAVYEATDLSLKRKVAVKITLGKWFGNREALRRFEREAQAAAALRHPNIVTVYDYGRIGTEGAYLVMERLYGASWRAELRRRGRLSAGMAADWFEQLLSGLECAHEAGVVHRDLKPENVLISDLADGSQRVTILDFGLARRHTVGPEETTSLTAAGAVVGTVGYIAPEQFRGEEAGPSADLYAVGVMVVESLTGRRPEGSEWAGGRLEEVVKRSLEADPRNRYASAAEMRQALADALSGSSVAPSSGGTSLDDLETRSLGAQSQVSTGRLGARRDGR
jgi:serine/threonine protein kinase